MSTDCDPNSSDTPRRVRCDRVILWVVAATWLWHVTLRDRWCPISMWIYMSPPEVLSVVLAGSLGWAAWRGESKPWLAAGCVMLVLLGGLVGVRDWRFHSTFEKSPQTSIRVGFWNLNRGVWASWDRMACAARDFDADVLGFVEAVDELPQTSEFWQARFPNHQVLTLGGGFVVLVRGQVTREGAGVLRGGGRFRRLKAEVNGQRFTLVLADLPSDPWMSRERPLRHLSELLAAQTESPTLVVGDFNTPTFSVWFDELRSDWTNAFDFVGQGYCPTWPMPLPVLTLDQMWGNRHIQFHRAENHGSLLSDHRMVLAEFSVVKVQ